MEENSNLHESLLSSNSAIMDGNLTRNGRLFAICHVYVCMSVVCTGWTDNDSCLSACVQGGLIFVCGSLEGLMEIKGGLCVLCILGGLCVVFVYTGWSICVQGGLMFVCGSREGLIEVYRVACVCVYRVA